MSAFARHGIKHLSASSLNLFASQPALWIGKYLLGWRDEFGPAGRRGTAVEAGLDHWLFSDRTDKARRDAKEAALSNFTLNTGGQCDDAHEAEIANIPPMLEQATIALAGAPVPVGRQMKVEFWLPDIDVPVIGYLDYLFDDGIIDLKTTKRMPSTPSKAHVAQMAGYAKAREQSVSLLYVTDKRHQIVPVTPAMVDEGYDDLIRAARALQYCLASSRDAHEAARYYVPDFTDFHWSDETIALGKALYQEAA